MRSTSLLVSLGVALLPVVAGGSARSAHAQEPRPACSTGADRCSARVDSLFAEYEIGVRPGLAVAVVRDGAVVLRAGYGMADLEHRVPVTPETVFDVASVSKQFTGLAVSMLVEEGRIGLDDDIRDYIPELRDFGHTITVRHLLHHTSGLRDWPGTLAVAGWRMDDVIAFDQILRMAYAQRTLNFVPGSEYTYSNTGYNLLAELVARVTGTSFRAWTRENLFEPLGMRDTHFHDDHTEVDERRAFGYARNGDGYSATANNLTAVGSSSLYSTVDDLAKWIANFENPRVGGPAAMRRTRTRGVLNDGSEIPYAFGIGHGRYRGLATLAHSGSWASFTTYVVHFPEERFGVVVLANGGGTNAQRAAYDVVDVYLADRLATEPVDGSGTGGDASGGSAEEEPAPSLDAARLEAYAGTYESEELLARYDVAVEGGELVMRHYRHGDVALAPVGPDRFRGSVWFMTSVVFERDAAGEVTGLSVTAGERNRDIRFARVR